MKEENDGSSWVLPFGDLMSLLLAIFVMIAAMSELRGGVRFDAVNSGVRSAFGFRRAAAVAPTSEYAEIAPLHRQLIEAGLAGEGASPNANLPPQISQACEIRSTPDGVVWIRLKGQATFDKWGADLHVPARQALAVIAGVLTDPDMKLEVRTHNGDGAVPMEAPYRDALDLSYARARAVVSVLEENGVEPDRISISAMGDLAPLGDLGDVEEVSPANRRVEMTITDTSGDDGAVADRSEARG